MKDNFSSQAANYAKYRPQYPRALFEYINSFVSEKKLAWDCGTGNGQTATVLSEMYEQVYASDISIKQIEQAPEKNNLRYVVESAEKTSLPDHSVDLVTVSQALHWFRFEDFYAEVRRVAKPKAVMAAWTYHLLRIDPETDKWIEEFYTGTLEQYWDKERKLVDDGYQSIPFPFEPINDPGFFIELSWNLEEVCGYLESWSAVQKYISANGHNPVDALHKMLEKSWRPGEIKKIRFPLFLKLAYVHPEQVV
jgi:hypothetical protein